MLFALAVVVALSHSSAAHDNDLESWYIYWGLGVVDNTYQDSNDWPFGGDPIALAMDAFGFYWPLSDNRTLVGGVVNGNVEVYEFPFPIKEVEINEVRFRNVEELEITLYNLLYSFSTMHFLTHEIGQGPFVRVDMGFAGQRGELDTGTVEIAAESDWGAGFLLGGGYGIPVTNGTRLLINANFSLRYIESITTSVGLTLNGLF